MNMKMLNSFKKYLMMIGRNVHYPWKFNQTSGKGWVVRKMRLSRK